MLKKASRPAADMISREPRDRAQPGGHSVCCPACPADAMAAPHADADTWLAPGDHLVFDLDCLVKFNFFTGNT